MVVVLPSCCPPLRHRHQHHRHHHADRAKQHHKSPISGEIIKLYTI